MLLYFIIGCCIGSFLCLTAQRIPLGHSIIYPRSHCVKCCRSLSWYELIPILSIIVQRFRCRYCRCRLPFYYLLAEVLCGGLFIWFFTFSSARNFSTFIWVLSALLFSLMDLFYFMVHSHTLFCSWAVLWIFWLQAGVFQWHSMLLTFIVGAACLRYGQSYLGAGDILCWCFLGVGACLWKSCFGSCFWLACLEYPFFLFTLSVIKKSWKSCLSFLF